MPGTFDSTFDATFGGGSVTLTSIAVTTSSTPIAGGSVQFTATGIYSDLSTANLTTQVLWASSNTNVARIDTVAGIADFMFTAGSCQITATLGVIGAYNVTIGNASFTPDDVVGIGLSRLPIQFKDRPIMSGILQCVLPSLVQLEQSIARTIAQRDVNVATGMSLTALGKLVGLARLTAIDDDFRRYVRARVATNGSLASFEDILTIARLVLGPTYVSGIILRNEGIATARLRFAGPVDDVTAAILGVLELQAVAAGVRLVIQYSPSLSAAVFAFDTGPGFNVGRLASSIG